MKVNKVRRRKRLSPLVRGMLWGLLLNIIGVLQFFSGYAVYDMYTSPYYSWGISPWYLNLFISLMIAIFVLLVISCFFAYYCIGRFIDVFMNEVEDKVNE